MGTWACRELVIGTGRLAPPPIGTSSSTGAPWSSLAAMVSNLREPSRDVPMGPCRSQSQVRRAGRGCRQESPSDDRSPSIACARRTSTLLPQTFPVSSHFHLSHFRPTAWADTARIVDARCEMRDARCEMGDATARCQVPVPDGRCASRGSALASTAAIRARGDARVTCSVTVPSPPKV